MALTRDEVFWTAFSSHAEKCLQASKLLVELMEHPETVDKLTEQVFALEREGDDITEQMITALHQTWITPLDREEIHALITYLDDVLDNIESAVDRFALYEITEPLPDAVKLAHALHGEIEVMNRAVVGLRQKDMKPLLALTKEIGRKEREIDSIYRKALAALHKPGQDLLLVLKWRDVLWSLEEAADRAQEVAHVIEGIVLEHS